MSSEYMLTFLPSDKLKLSTSATTDTVVSPRVRSDAGITGAKAMLTHAEVAKRNMTIVRRIVRDVF